jgi:hypothetical protein
MADNSLKTPFGQALNRLSQLRATDVAKLLGQGLPASVVSVSGSIVTVKFEITGPFTLPHVTMPVGSSEYVRLPLQPGDRGVALPASAYLGGVSGLGGGVADLTQRANLSNLVFFPIGNKSFSTVNGQSLVLYGPSGVTLEDKAKTAVIDLSPGRISLKVGTVELLITSAGISIQGISFITHQHTGVTTGSGETGGVAT